MSCMINRMYEMYVLLSGTFVYTSYPVYMYKLFKESNSNFGGRTGVFKIIYKGVQSLVVSTVGL